METFLPPVVTLLLAGLGGALVFAFLRPDRESTVRSVGNLAVGTIVSFWLTPALCDWRGLESIHARHAVAFGLGLVGMIACKAFVAAVESEAAKDAGGGLVRALKRALGWKDDA